jgi:hypothetical protein
MMEMERVTFAIIALAEFARRFELKIPIKAEGGRPEMVKEREREK